MGSPPAQNKCFRSIRNRRRPVCTKPIRHQRSCEFCNISWGLHRQQMATMAKNRKAAKVSKEKRILAFEDLENEYDFNTFQYQNEVETLAEINRLNEAIAAEINKAEEEIRNLKIERASRG